MNSPCIGVCEIDGETGFCRGCYRTVDEIAAWRDASPDVKEGILAHTAARRTGRGTRDGDG
ncbi:MAG: DUF1289 domain-containing protein [Rhodospirillales bacterium]|nr:DUF1289 domain-containing protein [Rhodospirillales bacterium]